MLSRLCVAQKKTLYLFEFTQGEYVLLKEISIGESAIEIAWHGDKKFSSLRSRSTLSWT